MNAPCTGLSEMVPGLDRYLDGSGEGIPSNVMVDGGYYSKAPDNVPLIGPSAPGFYTCTDPMHARTHARPRTHARALYQKEKEKEN